MKSILFLIVAIVGLMASAATTPIDRELETVVVENPTLENRFFCGVNNRIIDAAVFVCASQGYSQAQILERAMAGAGNLCWTVEPRGTSHYFELVQANAVLTKVKCSRVKQDATKPLPPTVPDPINKPDPGNPYPVPQP